MHMNDYSKITALYSRLSVGDEDRDSGKIGVCIMKDMTRWGTNISKWETLWWSDNRQGGIVNTCPALF